MLQIVQHVFFYFKIYMFLMKYVMFFSQETYHISRIIKFQ